MRTLTAHNAAETAKQITEPFYLVHLGFDTPLYLCSLKTITLNSITWSGSRTIRVPAIKTDNAGNQSGSIQLSNIDRLISGLILTEGCAGKVANIYKGYGNPTDADIVSEFSGFMDDSDIDDTSVTILLTGKGNKRFSPGIILSKPYLNHMPPAGTIIKSGNTTITLNTGSR